MSSFAMGAVDAVVSICRRTLSASGNAIRFEGCWISWQQVAAIADAIEQLLSEAGVDHRVPIAFAPRNTPSSLAAFLPLLTQRRCIRMVYPFQSPEALAASLDRLAVGAVVMDAADFAPGVMEVLQRRGVAGIALAGERASFAEGLAHCSAEVTPEEARLEILTSGTTGPPKHFPIGYDIVAGYIDQAQANEAPDTPPPLLCFPLSNISGLYTLAASFLLGRPVILLDRFTVAAWRDYVVEFRPSSGGAPPAALGMILAEAIPREDLASLRFFSTGAAPLDVGIQRRFEETYGIPVLQTYGATEFGGPVTAMTPQLRTNFGDAVAGSVGRPFGGARVRIRRADGAGLAGPGEVGIVEVVSPRIGPDWIVTSDLGLLDENGFLFLKGRADGAIMRGGFKIVPEVVEAALLAHPAVAACSVVGLPDERLLEIPAAAVEIEPGHEPPTDAELAAHLRTALPAPNIPARWLVVEALPRTVSFKIDRAAVRALFSEATPSPER